MKDKKTKTEAMINGIVVTYDACSSDSLQDAKKYYGDAFDYIGTGYIYSTNGVRQFYTEKDVCHFFTKKKIMRYFIVFYQSQDFYGWKEFAQETYPNHKLIENDEEQFGVDASITKIIELSKEDFDAFIA